MILRKANQKCYSLDADKKFIEVKGYPVKLSGWMGDLDLFVHRSIVPNTIWQVSEGTSGYAASNSQCATRQIAIDSVIANFIEFNSSYKGESEREFRNRLQSDIKKTGLSPRYEVVIE